MVIQRSAPDHRREISRHLAVAVATAIAAITLIAMGAGSVSAEEGTDIGKSRAGPTVGARSGRQPGSTKRPEPIEAEAAASDCAKIWKRLFKGLRGVPGSSGGELRRR